MKNSQLLRRHELHLSLFLLKIIVDQVCVTIRVHLTVGDETHWQLFKLRTSTLLISDTTTCSLTLK